MISLTRPNRFVPPAAASELCSAQVGMEGVLADDWYVEDMICNSAF